MMEQDAVHIGYEADVTAYLLDTNAKKTGVTGLLDTGAVVSVDQHKQGMKDEFSFTFLSEKIGKLILSVIILLINFLTYLRSGFLILIRPLFKSIITSKFRTKSRPRMSWSESSKFLTTRKLIQRSRPPM